MLPGHLFLENTSTGQGSSTERGRTSVMYCSEVACRNALITLTINSDSFVLQTSWMSLSTVTCSAHNSVVFQWTASCEQNVKFHGQFYKFQGDYISSWFVRYICLGILKSFSPMVFVRLRFEQILDGGEGQSSPVSSGTQVVSCSVLSQAAKESLFVDTIQVDRICDCRKSCKLADWKKDWSANSPSFVWAQKEGSGTQLRLQVSPVQVRKGCVFGVAKRGGAHNGVNPLLRCGIVLQLEWVECRFLSSSASSFSTNLIFSRNSDSNLHQNMKHRARKDVSWCLAWLNQNQTTVDRPAEEPRNCSTETSVLFAPKRDQDQTHTTRTKTKENFRFMPWYAKAPHNTTWDLSWSKVPNSQQSLAFQMYT